MGGGRGGTEAVTSSTLRYWNSPTGGSEGSEGGAAHLFLWRRSGGDGAERLSDGRLPLEGGRLGLVSGTAVDTRGGHGLGVVDLEAIATGCGGAPLCPSKRAVGWARGGGGGGGPWTRALVTRGFLHLFTRDRATSTGLEDRDHTPHALVL